MSALILRSKIWPNESTQAINYKEKNFKKQKISIESSGIIFRQKDKVYFKKTEESNLTSNSNDNTNYMNEKKIELLSISKQQDNKFIINCGNWSKDITKLIDENAAYLLYKGLTIENLLKEKQKYYVLNQGDIIKLGKIYLKLLHINLNNRDNEEDNDDKNEEGNKIEELKEEEKEEEKEDEKEDKEEEDKKEEEEKKDEEDKNEEAIEIDKENKILLTYTRNSKNNNSKRNEILNSYNKKNKESLNYSFSYANKDYKNINLYVKKYVKENKKNAKDGRNKSFNGSIPLFTNNIIKESVNIGHSKSPKFISLKNYSIIANMESNSNTIKGLTSSNIKKKSKLIKNQKKQIKPKKHKLTKMKNSISSSETPVLIGKICRICLSGEDDPIKNPLVCPCICKGSMKYIHYLCLKNWLNLKVESELGHHRNLLLEQPTITYSTNDISCELCKAKLPDYIRHKGKIYNVLFYKPNYDKFLVLESLRDDNKRTKFIHIIPLVKKNLVKIGRLNTCDLSLPDSSVSRVHCCVYIEDGQIFLENNSKYGTKILVQNNNLIMSANYPLCLEIQNTYLKLELKKNFNLFSCCEVGTTTISKMLVYQEQNEKGFDIFCSMIIKDDEDNENENIEEDKKDENNEEENINNYINRINKINESCNKRSFNEESKKYESNEIINNLNIDITKKELTEDYEQEQNDKNNNNIKKKYNEHENSNNKGIISIQNKSKENLCEEEIVSIETEENNIIKSIKIIPQDKNNNNKKYMNKTADNDEYNIHHNISEIKSNIYYEMNRTQILEGKSNEKILSNLRKEKYKNDELNKQIKKHLDEDKDKLKDNKIELNNKETQRMEINNKEKKDKKNQINELILSKDNKDKSEINSNINNDKYNKKSNNKIINIEKNEKNNTKISNEIKNINIEEENKINSPKKISYTEENNNDNNSIKLPIIHNKDLETEKLNKEKEERKKSEKQSQDKEKIEFEEKLNKKIKQKIKFNNRNDSINLKETRPDKTSSEAKIDFSKTTIKYDKKSINMSQNDFKNDKLKSKIEENKINKESKLPKKLLNQSIDLNAINELSYGNLHFSCNINKSPIDTYQSIFGLRQKQKNEGTSLLAPKHKNINFQKLELNSNKDKNNNLNKSNASWNRYTYQYEEDKKSKINNN